MSEPEPAGWDPSFSEALWRETGSRGDRRLHEPADRLADHIDAFWGQPRPEDEPDAATTLHEAVWGTTPPERAVGESALEPWPEQLALFDVPARGPDERPPT